MKSVHISVAMATFNGETFLREQLDSLSQQELLPYELIVGDDGSTDRTLEIIEDFAVKAPFPVRITSNPKNLGFGDNFLAAAQRCTGDWIAFCDQDDVWLPNKLSDCAAAIEAHPDLCQVLQRAELCDVELNYLGRIFPSFGITGVHDANSQFGFWVWLGFLQTVRADTIHDIEHSVRQRLLDVSKKRKVDYQFCLTHYALERFLYRLSKSSHAEKFVLKGALLLMSWTNEPYRPTRDLDLLGFGDATPDNLKTVIMEICLTEVEPDGLVFNTDTITIEEIRGDLDYDGHRVKILVYS